MEKKDEEYDIDYEVYEFGWKPEIAGVIGVILLIWYLISFARGSL